VALGQVQILSVGRGGLKVHARKRVVDNAKRSIAARVWRGAQLWFATQITIMMSRSNNKLFYKQKMMNEYCT
jgi:hypothetical protein